MGLPKLNGLYRLTKDAELKYSASGSAILKLNLAASEKFGDKETQLFIDATAFGKPAEIISQYAGQKGTQIFISGKLQTETWDKDGVKQYKTSMIVEGFDFVSKPKDGGGNEAYTPPAPTYQKHTDYRQPAAQSMPTNTLPEIDIDEAEIPF
jgi:single-strand DNA-binding protein